MDSAGLQRKRGGRIAKNINTIEKSHTNEVIENSAVAISPTLDEPESTNCAPTSECRRSSRKKIIKFDVRDLLNKNRKTHKIQIEARIDSNAPSTSKAAAGDFPTAANLKSTASKEDLLSKHKTFLEKSAIFRRYSISQEQKPPPILPIPPLLSKSNESKDSAFCGTSSSQEFLSHALIKPKQPTSLILAQIESNKPITVNISKRKGPQKTLDMSNIVINSEAYPIVQQKKRGRPAKIKTQTSEEKATANVTPEKAKNWKEYKACLAQQSGSNNGEKNSSKIKEQIILSLPQQRNQTLIRKLDCLHDSSQSDILRSDDDGSFSGFQISKDDISCDSPVLEEKLLEETNINVASNKDTGLRNKTESSEKIITFETTVIKNDITCDKNKSSFSAVHQDSHIEQVSNIKNLNLDISNQSKSNTEKNTKPAKGSDVEEDNQEDNKERSVIKNLKIVNVIPENKLIAPDTNKDLKIIKCTKKEKESNITSKGDIAAKVLDISRNLNTNENKKSDKIKYSEQTLIEAEKLCIERKCSMTTTCIETLAATHIHDTVTETKNSLLSSKKKENFSIFTLAEETPLLQFSTPSYGNKSFSRTSSSSESENASDRSLCSSEPFSTTASSSPRSFKSASVVKVSVKRISLPKSPSTSSQTSTSEELNNANMEKRKPPIAKRSKRIKKKKNISVNTDDISATLLDRDVEGQFGFLATNLSTQEYQSETFATCSKEKIKFAPSEMFYKNAIIKSDESSISSEIKSSKTNESPNEDFLAVGDKTIKRKSLRNRKDNIYHTKGEVTETTNFEETQLLLSGDTGDVQSLDSEETNTENIQEKSKDEKMRLTEKSIISDQNDKSEDYNQGKTLTPTRRMQTPTQQNKGNFGKPTTTIKQEILSAEDKSEHQQDITIHKITNSLKDSNFVEFGNKNNISMINKADTVVYQTKTLINESVKSGTITCLANEAETFSKGMNIQQGNESILKKDENQEQISMQSTSEYQACQNENTDSKNYMLGTQNKSNSPDKLLEIASTYNVIDVALDSADNTEYSKCQPTKPEPDKNISSKNFTNKGELNAKTSKNAEETSCQDEEEIYKTVTVASKKESNKNNDDIFELMQVKSPVQNLITHIVEKEDDGKINADTSTDNNKVNVLLQDLKFQDKKEDNKDAKEKNEANTTIVRASNTIKQKVKVQLEEIATNADIMNIDNSKSAQPETGKEPIESEKMLKNMKIDRKTKEDISCKESSVKEEIPTHSATQQDMKMEQEAALKIPVNKKTCVTEKSLKDVTTGKLIIVTPEIEQKEILTKDSETDKIHFSKSEFETANCISTNKIGSNNIITLTETKENLKKIDTVYSKRTILRKNSNSPKETKRFISSNEISLCGSTEKVGQVSAEIPQALKDADSKIILLQHLQTAKHSSEGTLDEIFQGTEKVTDSTKFITDNSSGGTYREIPLEDRKKTLCVSDSAGIKRRGRKPYFKNIQATDDSETDSSNGKITPINEVIQEKHNSEIKLALQENNVDIESLRKSLGMEMKGKHESLKPTEEEPFGTQEDAATNLSTTQIKNVSIETNTLLDILRTVQSNTAAALKASKSLININKIDYELSANITSNISIEVSSKSSEDSMKHQQHVTDFPIIFDVSSSTAKKLNLSPERSNSNSPLTLKKVTSSPTRSNSSSPLTLKKVTRRYERRSRRGEESAHKTLEETFAEIAAQSSKAVLAAKEFEEKSPEDFQITSISAIADNKQVKENLKDFEKISAPSEMNSNGDRNKVDDLLLNVARDIDNQLIVPPNEICDYPIENIIDTEMGKNTPARRGRKQKNRSSELITTGAKDNEVICSKSIKESKDKNIKTNFEKYEETEYEPEKVNESLGTSLNENLSYYKEKTLSPLTTYSKETELPTTTLKQVDDMNENKPTIKCNKRCENKDETEEDNSSVDPVLCQEKSDEIPAPKQMMKKRDSSQNKGEIKSATKRAQKKAKNEEEDLLNLLKEDASIKNAATTTPLSKRGRKPKNQQADTSQSATKNKAKKNNNTENEGEEANEENVKLFENESDSSLNKLSDEKLAKKTRQKKLKEAFEAALTENKEQHLETSIAGTSTPTKILSFDLNILSNSPPPERMESFPKVDQIETIKHICITSVVSEEDPDPLKDIEKFIADGVNLLKKDYKLEENSVDDVIQRTPIKGTEIVDDSVKMANDDVKIILNTFETPADTPINTPSVTPPPKSPSSLDPTTPDENSGVRRSHRIKLITKAPKALVGRGLVRDRERFSIKDDVETKSHYTLDDHLTDLAEVEAKNAKFLKAMEERLSNFQVIKENEYLCERVISREARKMICDCFLTHEEEDRGELGCGEDCLNRLLMIECGFECNVKERCTNKRFQKLLCSPCRVFRTEKKGFGIMADIEILPGEFIMEYVGEVINTEEFEKRRIMYSQEKNRHYYFMALRSDAIIDATIKGNISRFINHSCDPNAETQKWTVNGELRIGFFSRKSIMPGEEITFNYQYQRYGREAQRCYCESSNCTGWIGQEPTSDEGEQIDDEDDETEDEEEEAVTTNLLVQDDEDDSDASVADPEEVQKRLEMAAAQAEAELAPLQLLQERGKQVQPTSGADKTLHDFNKSDNEEDSKSKFKKLLSKMAAKQKQSKREQKLQRKKKSKESSELTNKLRFLEDPDIEDEVQFLKECGLKNQSDTLRLSRLMVRAKLVQTRLNLLEILRKGDFPCRRLFLDYHGLRLLHGWMSEDGGNMQIRLSLLQTLQTLPIANKTVLTDSKVMQVVRTWSGPNNNLSPNEDSSSSNSNSQDVPVQGSTSFEESSEVVELQKLAFKLNTAWEGLPEIFRIPKKERIEQMKEHEREADRQYAANVEIRENVTHTDRYRRDRFGRGLNTSNNSVSTTNRFIKPNNGNPHKTASTTPENLKNLSKAQRRELFAAKVARDEAEKRLAEERREFETKCRFFGLDQKKIRAKDMPFCVNPATGQWFSIERKPITTPPSYAHVQVPVKSKSTDPNDYQLPAVCSTLPPQWKYAITLQGKIYFYHIKHRLPQWEPPSPTQLQQCELEANEEESESENTSTAGDDSSDDDDDILIGMDAAQLKAYINRKVEMRRQKRYQRLVDERSISPRREEDRIYNQIEVRKYKENKEKIRKRKEDIRRKRAEALRQSSLSLCTLGSITDAITNTSKLNTEVREELAAVPIQDYLLSSDEEVDIKTEVNSPLIDKIVEGDKIVDELDALTTKRQLKRPLPPHRDLSEISTSTLSSTSALIATTAAAKQEYKQEYKKRKLEKREKRKPKEQDTKYRKNKEKFRCEIAGIIVHHLKPYLKETCTLGRIQSNEDFNHLARKLTHFVMIKELKYCESVGQTLVVTESVKSKSREFIKKYMAKYGDFYVKATNDPDFKDIPFTL